jgi:S1-C subfamily serine protease
VTAAPAQMAAAAGAAPAAAAPDPAGGPDPACDAPAGPDPAAAPAAAAPDPAGGPDPAGDALAPPAAGPDPAGPGTSPDPPAAGASPSPSPAGPDPPAPKPLLRRRPGRTVTIAVTSAVIGAAVGATVGAVIALHSRHNSTTTIVREAVPAPDRVAKINDVPSIIARVEPAVVSITTDQGSGTGIVITPSGQLVTNYHVIAGANYIHVVQFHQTSFKVAAVVGYDQTDDVALLQLQTAANNLPTATFGDSDQLQVGADVVAIGNALDLPGGPTVTSGIVSALGRTIANSSLPVGASAPPNLIETDAAINPGNSGGPLLDADGDVIGIDTLVLDNLGFAIPIDTVKDLLPALSAGSQAAAISLGIGIQDDNDQLASEYGLRVTTGALVSEVTPGSPAERAGVEAYDVVVDFSGQPVSDTAQLIALIAARKPADVAPLTVVRGTRTLHLQVTFSPGATPTS